MCSNSIVIIILLVRQFKNSLKNIIFSILLASGGEVYTSALLLFFCWKLWIYFIVDLFHTTCICSNCANMPNIIQAEIQAETHQNAYISVIYNYNNYIHPYSEHIVQCIHSCQLCNNVRETIYK